MKYDDARSLKMTSSLSPDVEGAGSPIPSDISEGSCYLEEDDLETCGPPRLAPVSGVFSPMTKTVIRPVAFKPVLPCGIGSMYVSPPCRPGPSPYSSSGSSGSYGLVKLMGGEDCLSLDSRLKLSGDEFPSTPSPSEGVVAELETLLREKDAEIVHLRETLEHNEQVIFKVYQEKEQMWQNSIRNLKEQYEAKLRLLQKKLADSEHMLGIHRIQNEQDKQELMAELEAVKRLREAAESKADHLRVRLEDAEWTLNHKAGEVTLLRSQLKGDRSAKVSELMCLKGELRDRDLQLSALRDQVADLMEGLGVNADLIQLNEELNTTKQQLEITREKIIAERRQWEEEKMKVIRYQKTLQMNYVHVCRRNRTLEKELQQLAIELQEKSGESHC